MELLGIICSSFPAQNGASGEASVKGYVLALEDIDPTAVISVLTNIIKGTQKDFGRVWRPTPAEIAEWSRQAALAAHKRSVPLYSGIIETDFGHGMIDMRGLTVDEQDMVLRYKGISPDGKNLALMSLDEKREALSWKALAKTRMDG